MNNEKKIKRNFLISGGIILIIALVFSGTVLVRNVLLKNQNDQTTLGGNFKKVEQYSKSKISNVVEVNTELPNFTIRINGIYYEEINETSVREKGVSVYEFDGKIFNGWETKENRYTGIRVTELFRAFGYDEYNEVVFDAVMGTPTSSSTLLNKSRISDECYLVFLRDGKPLEEYEPVSFIPFDKNYMSRVENLEFITFY